MTDFLNITLPNFIAIDVLSSPIFHTKIIHTQNGREYRYPLQDSLKFKYKILNSKITYEQFDEFNKFFTLCQGKRKIFKMKDFRDNEIKDQILAIGPSNERTFRIYKNYGYDQFSYRRKIVKITQNSLIVKINDETINPNIDYENGIINLNEPLIENQELKISLKYEVLVRFDSDSLDYKYEPDGTISITNLDIVEVIL
jgi:uncharacterized protein (TIGR02217 family)